MNGDNLITLSGLTFGYPGRSAILENAGLTLDAGERVGLMGDIGSGKTTLLHLIVGLLRPASGRVEAFGQPRSEERDFREVRERVGLLFQDPEDQLFCPTVKEDIAFGPLNQGKSRAVVEQIVGRTLARVGMAGYEERITHHLSGGEKRLVALATVLAMEPDVLLLDEPENGLDPAAYERITTLLVSLPQAMLIVSHNTGFLRRVTTRCLRLNRDRAVAFSLQAD